MVEPSAPSGRNHTTGIDSPPIDSTVAWAASELGERPGDLIGPYKLLSILGEGGFGVVYLAERRHPIVQRVALKIIKPGMDSRAVIARFEQERQALAVMDHPNVARVFDAGATPTGRPYFVMEHVQGEPITEYCDRQRLTIKQRLELFIPVCEAVQHAHMKGIIHRDIKPSNILVTIKEGAAGPVPKVIDFGVAKAISHTLTDKTIFTEQGQIIGTPEYMSPEQAEMGATDIDTRSDVYSLGVVLYELLTGLLPFDPKTLRSAGYAEIQRIIREVDPPKPSTRLTSLKDDNRTSPLAPDSAGGSRNTTAIIIANHRQSKIDELTRQLRRELEWIPLKAMRKDRTQRYKTASQITDDITNYLSGRALVAGPESRMYRLRKVIRSNRQLITITLLALALVLYAIAWGAWRADRAIMGEYQDENDRYLASMQESNWPLQIARVDEQLRHRLEHGALRLGIRFETAEQFAAEPSGRAIVGALKNVVAALAEDPSDSPSIIDEYVGQYNDTIEVLAQGHKPFKPETVKGAFGDWGLSPANWPQEWGVPASTVDFSNRSRLQASLEKRIASTPFPAGERLRAKLAAGMVKELCDAAERAQLQQLRNEAKLVPKEVRDALAHGNTVDVARCLWSQPAAGPARAHQIARLAGLLEINAQLAHVDVQSFFYPELAHVSSVYFNMWAGTGLTFGPPDSAASADYISRLDLTHLSTHKLFILRDALVARLQMPGRDDDWFGFDFWQLVLLYEVAPWAAPATALTLLAIVVRFIR